MTDYNRYFDFDSIFNSEELLQTDQSFDEFLFYNVENFHFIVSEIVNEILEEVKYKPLYTWSEGLPAKEHLSKEWIACYNGFTEGLKVGFELLKETLNATEEEKKDL